MSFLVAFKGIISGLLDSVVQAKLMKDNKELNAQTFLNEAKIKTLQDVIKVLRKGFLYHMKTGNVE
jgi:hypothetical protein